MVEAWIFEVEGDEEEGGIAEEEGACTGGGSVDRGWTSSTSLNGIISLPAASGILWLL
ncbi:cytochrome c oxidase subunit I [Sesbania bispinosa]|nr:cytochrome c oxidase subunit I [Sesbania bispinosa]